MRIRIVSMFEPWPPEEQTTLKETPAPNLRLDRHSSQTTLYSTFGPKQTLALL